MNKILILLFSRFRLGKLSGVFFYRPSHEMDCIDTSKSNRSSLMVQADVPSKFSSLFSLAFHHVCGTSESSFSVNYHLIQSRLLLLGVQSKIPMIWVCAP